ncbi:MAG: glycosyltransferase, partial [Gammaproteobacteria bacterium]
MEAVAFMGVRIHRVYRQDLLGYILEAAGGRQQRLITNVNVRAMNLAWQDPYFRAILNGSDLVFVDGYGVVLGARLAGLTLGERLTPADWLDEMFEGCAEKGYGVFWLGDTEEVCQAFSLYLKKHHPTLRFAGYHHGFFKTHGPENEAAIAAVNASGAEVLLVGMGMPRQEKWLWENRHRLHARALITAGGYARIATGFIPRGPRWMTQHGLEWLYRLMVQPGYTWRRYL